MPTMGFVVTLAFALGYYFWPDDYETRVQKYIAKVSKEARQKAKNDPDFHYGVDSIGKFEGPMNEKINAYKKMLKDYPMYPHIVLILALTTFVAVACFTLVRLHTTA